MHTPVLERAAFALLSFTLATIPALAQQTIVIGAAADNTLYQSTTGATSNGAGPAIFIGATSTLSLRRAVLQFDVAAAVPAGAKILSATLQLNVVRANTLTAHTATGHRLLAAWGEGTSATGPAGGGSGVPSTNGDATWIHTFFPNTMWSTPGGDFAATPSFSMSLPVNGPATSAASAASAADVQSWLDQPASNFGWLLRGDETAGNTARKCDSRESASGNPTLTVTYITPGQTAAIGTGCAVGTGTFTLAIVGTPAGGTSVGIAKSNAPALQFGANLFALSIDPAGTLLPPGCRLYLPFGGTIVTGNLFATDAQGAQTDSLAIPLGFPGVLIAAQAAVLHNNPAGYVLSNAGALCIQ